MGEPKLTPNGNISKMPEQGYGGWGNMKGRPPDDHPRRCHGIMRDGNRCTQWARKGLTRCNSHGARRSLKVLYNNGSWKGFMPNFYRKQLTATLSTALADQLQLESSEQFSILEELALTRETAADFVQLYGLAHAAYEADPSEEKLQAKMAAGTMLRDVLAEVAVLADKAAKIHFTGKQVFTALDLKLIVAQMSKIMFDICGTTNVHLAKEFEYAVGDRLKLPSDNNGTTITPDQDVIDMDATIPRAPEDATDLEE